MKSYYKGCPECQWRGKIIIPVSKKSLRRYARLLKQFEDWVEWAKIPKPRDIHIDMCLHCSWTWLVSSDKFPEIDKNFPNVAIIGWWIGWVALAVACLHRWINYTLYERDDSFDTRSQGYWLTLQQASKAIEWLWIFWLKEWLTSTKHVVHNTSWKIIWEWGIRKWLDEEILKPTKRRNVHISRQSLRKELLDQLHTHENIKWWHYLKNISNNWKSPIELEFQVGDKKELAYHDLVVWADGIRSSIRNLLIWEKKSPLKYLWCLVILGICPLSELWDLESELLDSYTVFQTVNWHERIYMMPYDKDTIMRQLSFPMSEEDAKKLSTDWPDALKKESIDRLWDWHSPVWEILKATNSSKISGYPVYDREILDPEFLKDFGNITLLWDATHPMSPFKWQGANQALLDALNLARGITSKCGPDSKWREKGLRKNLLEDFEIKMINRSALKVKDSARAVELLHSDAVLHEWNSPRWRWI